MGDGLCVLDARADLAFANPAAAKLIGVPTEKLVGVSFFRFVDGPELERVRAHFKQGAAPVKFEEFRLKTERGPVDVAISIARLPGEDAGSVVIFRDITEQRHLEISLRHAQRLEAVGRLAAGIAHEINTPIQFIGDNLSFLRSAHADLERAYRKVRAFTGEAHTEAITELERDADLEYITLECPRAIEQSIQGIGHVAEIVQAMKVFSHQDRSESQTRVDLNAALKSVVTVARSETKHVADVVLDLALLTPVLAFPNDLNQVFLNLIVNAAHTLADVLSTKGLGTIRIRTYREDEHAVVAIEDTGTGIPEAIRGQIFDPFFTTKDVGRGTGQGLALARAIVVDKHRGSLTFETEVGRGTTFYVRLPINGRVKARDHGVAA
jgi:PAS domain S-box-containing protein